MTIERGQTGGNARRDDVFGRAGGMDAVPHLPVPRAEPRKGALQSPLDTKSDDAVREAERRALLISAAVLMDEALRLLDEGRCSIAGVWLSHAADCLRNQLQSQD